MKTARKLARLKNAVQLVVMTFDAFKSSLKSGTPPEVNNMLLALWHERNGDWTKSHEIVQDIDSRDAAWIHAYLHRREGDESNAGYWYRRASKPFPGVSMDQEWEALCAHFLKE